MPAPRPEERTNSYPLASLFKRVLQLFREALDEKLRPFGVTAAQLQALARIDYEPGISGASLARACMVTPQSTQVLLRGIEKNGWVRRTRHPENERILLATLTPSGKRVLARSRTAINDVYEQMLHDFPPMDVHALEALLLRCSANLEAGRTAPPEAR